MLSMRLLARGNLPQYAATVQRLHTSRLLLDSSDSSSSDSDTKGPKKRVKSKRVETSEQKLKSQEETTARLNSLLQNMIQKPKLSKQIDISMPPKKTQPKRIVKEKPYENKLFGAAKDVATALGGDVKKTESDLLNKLLAAEKKELNEQQNEKKPSTPFNLTELIAGMKVDPPSETTSEPSSVMRRSTRAKTLLQKFESGNSTKFQRWESKRIGYEQLEAGNLYGVNPINVFNTSRTISEALDVPKLSTWETLQKKEFRLALAHPPENIFQEMIQWTEQGKLWKFPIDNEQGMEEEHNVHFVEHVFMERNLQDWCPKRGPIRHFMELVCVGLSKNPYMTVNEKKEHINWYREYFGSKEQLLQELGAIEGNAVEAKQIEK